MASTSGKICRPVALSEDKSSTAVGDVEGGGEPPRKSIRQRRRSSVLSDSWDNGDIGGLGQNSLEPVNISATLALMDKKPENVQGHQDKIGNKRSGSDSENRSSLEKMKKHSSDKKMPTLTRKPRPESNMGVKPIFLDGRVRIMPILFELCGGGAKTPSESVRIKMENNRKFSCLCLSDADICLGGKDVSQRCQAKDRIAGIKAACTVPSSDLKVYRAAEPRNFMLCCPFHVKRLRNHECCPFCGLFCNQKEGGVLICQQKDVQTVNKSDVSGIGHLFHAACAVKEYGTNFVSCPHCNSVGRLPVGGGHDFLSSYPSNNAIPEKIWATSALQERTEKSWVVIPSEEEAVGKGVEIEIQDIPTVDMKQVTSLRNNPTRVTQKLVKALDDYDYDVTSVVALIEEGADVNHRISNNDGFTILMKAVELKDLNLVHVLCREKANPNLADDFGSTPLMLAGSHNLPEIVHYLLAVGAIPELGLNTNGITALHGMAREGHVDAMKALDLPQRLELLRVRDSDQLNPLMTAARFGAHRVVTYLGDILLRFSLENLVTVKDKYGGTALHWGAFNGSLDILLALINLGADPNVQDNDGNTPLHVLLSTIPHRHVLKQAQALLTAGASHELTNKAGISAFDFCNSDMKDQLTNWCERLWNTRKAQKEVGLNLETLALAGNNFVVQDISGGREKRFPIPCVNNVDSSTLRHGKDFFYITEFTHGTSPLFNSIKIEAIHHCTCPGKCDPSTCSGVLCPRGTVGFEEMELYYNSSGRLNLPRKGLTVPLDNLVIYECNELCACDVKKCHNRLVQKGLGQMLQVFRTDNGKGWGVRSLRKILRGDFVMELVGENITEQLASSRTTKDFLYELKIDAQSRMYVDCGKYGNVARFLNHSCEPNLFPVKVFCNSVLPRICFFALYDIFPGQELHFDYTTLHVLSSVVDKVKKLSFHCKCNTTKCLFLNIG